MRTPETKYIPANLSACTLKQSAFCGTDFWLLEAKFRFFDPSCHIAQTDNLFSTSKYTAGKSHEYKPSLQLRDTQLALTLEYRPRCTVRTFNS
jgi:hypothetical protein